MKTFKVEIGVAFLVVGFLFWASQERSSTRRSQLQPPQKQSYAQPKVKSFSNRKVMSSPVSVAKALAPSSTKGKIMQAENLKKNKKKKKVVKKTTKTENFPHSLAGNAPIEAPHKYNQKEGSYGGGNAALKEKANNAEALSVEDWKRLLFENPTVEVASLFISHHQLSLIDDKEYYALAEEMLNSVFDKVKYFGLFIVSSEQSELAFSLISGAYSSLEVTLRSRLKEILKTYVQRPDVLRWALEQSDEKIVANAAQVIVLGFGNMNFRGQRSFSMAFDEKLMKELIPSLESQAIKFIPYTQEALNLIKVSI